MDIHVPYMYWYERAAYEFIFQLWSPRYIGISTVQEREENGQRERGRGEKRGPKERFCYQWGERREGQKKVLLPDGSVHASKHRCAHGAVRAAGQVLHMYLFADARVEMARD
jgi:hypothetical protein